MKNQKTAVDLLKEWLKANTVKGFPLEVMRNENVFVLAKTAAVFAYRTKYESKKKRALTSRGKR